MRRLFAFVTTGLILGHAFAGSAWIGRIAPPVQEIANRVENHVREQIRRGRLTLVEMDSFYLPDTQGTAYRKQDKLPA